MNIILIEITEVRANGTGHQTNPQRAHQPEASDQADKERLQTSENEERWFVPRIQRLAQGHDQGQKRIDRNLP